MDIKVRNALQALEAALSYLRRQDVPDIPNAGVSWRERRLYSPGIEDYAVTSKLFISGAWMIEVYQEVAPLSRTVYHITVYNSEFRWYWQGSVQADGTVTSLIPPKQLSEKEALETAAGISLKLEVPAPKPGGYGH
jgi:hypothetical protein